MNAVRFFRLAVGLLSLLAAENAAAQMRDVEYPTPRVPLSPAGPAEVAHPAADAPAPCAGLLPELNSTLYWQPYQVPALRHLAAPGAGAAPAAGPELRGLPTAAQRAWLRQWATAQPAGCRVGLVAALP